MRFPGGWVLAILLALQAGAAQSAPRAYTVRHSPEQPKSGETVRIIASGTVFDGLSNLTLQYQVVEPGKYIALADSAYAKSWTSVSMSRGVDPAAGPSYAVELPAALQKHRWLVRYRIAAGDKLLAPAQGDSETNFAYFVYDGVPAWRGAINPESNDPLLKEARVFSAEVMQSVQVYQFIASKPSVENVTWYGMFAPSKTPRDIIIKLNQQVVKILAQPEMAQRLASQGAEPRSSTPEELVKFMQVESARWKKVIQAAGIKLE